MFLDSKGFGVHHNLFTVGYTTFRKVIKQLCLTKDIKKYRAKPKTGLVSTQPNQFWHADVTIYKMLDGTKAFIYLVTDNFSNLILSWKATIELSAKTRKETIEQAYQKYGHYNPKIIYSDVFPLLNADLTLENQYIHLITDGGSENKGELDIYLSDPDVKVRKLIALKDIRYSNSPIEAANKILKYQELHLINIPDLKALIAALDKWIPVYNNERPNRKGNYLLTPYEIYNGKAIGHNALNDRFHSARTERINQNRNADCEIC